MAHGMVARNEHGVLLSADQKNYVFAGYYPAPAPAGSLYTFYVSSNPLSLYGIRLPVGGHGSVISAVAVSGGYRVTVFGASVLGLLVFSPISDGGRSGYGFALFDGAGACTFDSNQKHLVVSSAGALYPGGAVYGAGDVLIFTGAGIYPTITTTLRPDESYGHYMRVPPAGYNFIWFLMYGNVEYYVMAQITDVVWDVKRPVASRNAAGYAGVTQVLHSGRYTMATSQTPVKFIWPSLRPASWEEVFGIPGGYSYIPNPYRGADDGLLHDGEAYPYVASSYNTTQNLALVTDSALYL